MKKIELKKLIKEVLNQQQRQQKTFLGTNNKRWWVDPIGNLYDVSKVGHKIWAEKYIESLTKKIHPPEDVYKFLYDLHWTRIVFIDGYFYFTYLKYPSKNVIEIMRKLAIKLHAEEFIDDTKHETLPLLAATIKKETIFSNNSNNNKRISEDVYENFPIQLEDVIIPGISNNIENIIRLLVSLGYELDPGERGTYGSSEHSSPARREDVSIIDWVITNISIVITSNNNNETDVDIKKLNPQQKQILDKSLTKYIMDNKSEIEEKLIDELSS